MDLRLILLLLVTGAISLLPSTEGKRGSDRKAVRHAEWGEWQPWSVCSRTCGTGLSYRTRECIPPQRKNKRKVHLHRKKRRNRRHMSSNCIGLYKQIRVCNTQECRNGSKDFRQEQCEEYNSRTFRGRRFEWISFKSQDSVKNRCSLTCQAKGYRFVSRLAERVADGTLCDENDPSGICVAGQCKRVGCDGVLDSEVRFDKCGVCGGDNTSCHIISGIFTRRSLPYGYNKVATIPRGACNINITEIMPNRNFLALKLSSGQYMINGNWVVGASKEYHAAGTVFRYHRPTPSQLQLKGHKEFIIGKGPTNESIDVMLLKQQENHGIMYEYTIPMEPSVATSKTSRTSSNNQDRKPNWTKPEVKVKGPLTLAKAEEPLTRPADEGARPAVTPEFRPQLSDRYQKYGSKFANYLTSSNQGTASTNHHGGQSHQTRPQAPRDAKTQTAADSTRRHAGTVVVNVGRPSHQQVGTDRSSLQGAQPATPRKGHRLRHRGRHGGRNVINVALPVAPRRQYEHQAQSLGTSQTQPTFAMKPPDGSYVYPPVAGILPNQPLPPVQTSPRRIYRYPSGELEGPPRPLPGHPGYVAPYPHVIPSARRPYPDVLPVAAGVPPSSGHHRYDNVYYPPGQTPARWPLNDQISLNFPGAKYPLQREITNLDVGSDYTWRISGFSECSKTCGGGTQTTIIVCVKGASQAVVTDENCDNALKPETQAISCNTRLCPPAWEPTEWSPCSTSCGRGTQTRDVECRQMVALTDIRPVSSVLCQDLPKPDTVRICNDDRPCVRWKIGEWNKCSTECGRGQRTREVLCVNSEDRAIAENKCDGTRPRNVEICDMGSCAKTWFFTEWSTECSASCGEGKRLRKLHCSADPDRCSAIKKPEETQICQNPLPCGGLWFTGPWQQCSVTCGQGVMKREVMCMKKLGRMMPVGDENCLAGEKPETERPCEHPACAPHWFMTDWSKCTKTCDTGYQQRDLKCLDSAEQVSTRCQAEDKPDVWRTCNTMPCPTKTPDSSCRDEQDNCRLVVQARLCKYSFYKRSCCLSCAGSHHDGHHHDNHHETRHDQGGDHDQAAGQQHTDHGEEGHHQGGHHQGGHHQGGHRQGNNQQQESHRANNHHQGRRRGNNHRRGNRRDDNRHRDHQGNRHYDSQQPKDETEGHQT